MVVAHIKCRMKNLDIEVGQEEMPNYKCNFHLRRYGMEKFKAGDKAFILESNRIVREVEVVRCSGGMYIIRFAEGGGIQVKGHRLFATQEEAKAGMSGNGQGKYI